MRKKQNSNGFKPTYQKFLKTQWRSENDVQNKPEVGEVQMKFEGKRLHFYIQMMDTLREYRKLYDLNGSYK